MSKKVSASIISRFPAVFSKEVGRIKGYKAIISLRQGTKPIFQSVAYALQPTLEAELNRRVTPLVIVPKSLRVCDFKVIIYQCVKSYPLPTAEDIFAHLAGGRVFTKLDLSQAYLQLPVDDDHDSKDLLVINTPKGIFRYNWLSYGVLVAPAIFQSVMDCVLHS